VHVTQLKHRQAQPTSSSSTNHCLSLNLITSRSGMRTSGSPLPGGARRDRTGEGAGAGQERSELRPLAHGTAPSLHPMPC
jgi:hypothetical protein